MRSDASMLDLVSYSKEGKHEPTHNMLLFKVCPFEKPRKSKTICVVYVAWDISDHRTELPDF